MRADPTELMHGGERTEGDAVFHFDVAGKRRSIGHDVIAANLAIMGDVYVRHDPVSVAYAGHHPAALRPAIECAVLADDVAIPDLQSRWLTAVLLVLRRTAEGVERMDPIAFTNPGRSFDDDVRADPRTCAENDAGTNHAEWPHFYIRIELGTGVYDGARMDHLSLSRNAPSKSAVATTFPSTFPRPATFQMPRVVRTRSISMMS